MSPPFMMINLDKSMVWSGDCISCLRRPEFEKTQRKRIVLTWAFTHESQNFRNRIWITGHWFASVCISLGLVCLILVLVFFTRFGSVIGRFGVGLVQIVWFLGWSDSVLGRLGSVLGRIRPVWLNFKGLDFFDLV